MIFVTLVTSKFKSFYLIISESDGYMKEKSGSKYLIFDSANRNNEVLKKYNEL